MSEKILYTAEATITGDRVHGHGRTSDGNLEVDIRLPKELGGDGEGTNPEQLFAVGFGSCFENALKTVGRRKKVDVDDVTIRSKVMLLPSEERGFKLAVEMDVTLPSITDADQAKALVRSGHRVCPYSHATRGNIDVAFTVNGEPLGD